MLTVVLGVMYDCSVLFIGIEGYTVIVAPSMDVGLKRRNRRENFIVCGMDRESLGA